MNITKETRTVFTVIRKRQRKSYFSLKSACGAMARDIIRARYPDEKPEYEFGMTTYPGFHWTGLPRSNVMHRRLTRLVLRAYKDGGAS